MERVRAAGLLACAGRRGARRSRRLLTAASGAEPHDSTEKNVSPQRTVHTTGIRAFALPALRRPRPERAKWKARSRKGRPLRGPKQRMSDLLLPPKPPGSRLGGTVPGVMSPTPGHGRQVVPEARLGRVVGHVSAPSRHQRIYHRHMGNRSPEPPFSTKSMDSRPCYLLPRAQASRGRAFRRNNGAGVSGVIPAKPLAPAKAGVSPRPHR